MTENALSQIKFHLKIGKLPSISWLSRKLECSPAEAQAFLTEYRAMELNKTEKEPKQVEQVKHELPKVAEEVKQKQEIVFYNPKPVIQKELFKEEEIIERPEQKKSAPEIIPSHAVGQDMCSIKEPEEKIEEEHDPIHSNWFLSAITKYSLYAGMGIDLILGVVFFILLSTDTLSAVGMLMMAIIAVLFKVVAYINNLKLVWVLLMSLTWWGSVSLALSTIESQTKTVMASVKIDEKELNRLATALETAEINLNDAIQRSINVREGFRSEIAVRQDGIKQLEGIRNQAKNELDEFKKPKQNVHVDEKKLITAESAITVIPRTIVNGTLAMRIFLLFFSIMFGALEFIIVWSAMPKKKREHN